VKGNATRVHAHVHFARLRAILFFVDVAALGRRSRAAACRIDLTDGSREKRDDRQIVARNKRARHDYHILDSWEAGLVLTGTEVKSLRDGKATMADAYALVKDGEVFLLNLHISPYEKGNQFNTNRRERETVAAPEGDPR
jgi:hypothetical protein